MTGKRSGKLAFCGVMTALALVFLLLTATPFSTVALAALAAVCSLPVVVEAGKKTALLQYAAVAALSLVLVPAIEGKVMYIAFFGWYTVFKAWLEGKKLPWVAEWFIKLGTFVVVLVGGCLLLWFVIQREMPLDGIESILTFTLGIILLCGVFFIYDRGLSGLVNQYMTRLHSPLSRLFRF